LSNNELILCIEVRESPRESPMSMRLGSSRRLSGLLSFCRYLWRTLIVLFGAAVGTAGAQDAPPDIAVDRLALELRVDQVRQELASGRHDSSSEVQTIEVTGDSEPVAQWYNWPNWSNWANWNNWNNWANWFNR
jgi:hypothetical protein